MKQFAYVGCRTTKERNARGKGIRIFKIENGTWKPVGLLEGPVNPSYFCLNEAQDMLYTIHGDYSEVSAYRIQPDGNLSTAIQWAHMERIRCIWCLTEAENGCMWQIYRPVQFH